MCTIMSMVFMYCLISKFLCKKSIYRQYMLLILNQIVLILDFFYQFRMHIALKQQKDTKILKDSKFDQILLIAMINSLSRDESTTY
jgi:hypothetical protein